MDTGRHEHQRDDRSDAFVALEAAINGLVQQWRDMLDQEIKRTGETPMEPETVGTVPTVAEYPHLVAHLPAKMLAAMAPIIRNTQEYACSDYAFMTQKPIELMGTYLLPVSDGAVLMNTDGMRMVCLYEPTASVSQAVKLFCPDDLLDAATVKRVNLYDENGRPIPTEMHPRPGILMLHGYDNHGLAVLSMHNDDRAAVIPRNPDDPEVELESLVLGTWIDRSAGNVIDHTGFRVEPVDAKLLRAFAKQMVPTPMTPLEQMQVNSALLDDLIACAKAIGAGSLEIRVTKDGNAIELTSIENESFWAIVMKRREVMQVPESGYVWRRELAEDLVME